jgi:hypothetical protein
LQPWLPNTIGLRLQIGKQAVILSLVLCAVKFTLGGSCSLPCKCRCLYCFCCCNCAVLCCAARHPQCCQHASCLVQLHYQSKLLSLRVLLLVLCLQTGQLAPFMPSAVQPSTAAGMAPYLHSCGVAP